MKTAAIVVAVLLVELAAGFVYLHSGLFPIAASKPHFNLVWRLTDTVKTYSVRRAAADVPVPPLSDPALVERGFLQYRTRCAMCHGGPGAAPSALALGLEPPPPYLMNAHYHWNAAELFWITKHGIKMTGMPAWGITDVDDDIWAVVAFLLKLPEISPREYAQMEARAAQAAGNAQPAGP